VFLQESKVHRPEKVKLQMEQWGEQATFLDVRFGKMPSLKKMQIYP